MVLRWSESRQLVKFLLIIPKILNILYLNIFFPEQIPFERTERGTGSGFIVSDDGLIMTNAHVVEGTSFVSVLLPSGKTYEGRVLGIDSMTDVAVVKITAENLPTVILGKAKI